MYALIWCMLAYFCVSVCLCVCVSVCLCVCLCVYVAVVVCDREKVIIFCWAEQSKVCCLLYLWRPLSSLIILELTTFRIQINASAVQTVCPLGHKGHRRHILVFRLSVWLSVSLTHYHTHTLSLSPSLFLCLPHSLLLSFSHSFSVCLNLSYSHSLSLSYPHPLSICLSLTLSNSLSLSITLTLSSTRTVCKDCLF